MDPTQSQGPGSAEPYRALIGDAYRVFERDPLFRPDADFAFERKEALGSGGMGVVYRVYDRRFRREAALKVLQHAIASPLVIERFVREARVTALLDHPAIPAVYEFGRSGRGEYFILLKLIRGRTLQELMAELTKGSPSAIQEPGALAEHLRILIRVCEALAYAHERGVLHRDLKPENVMVGRHGDVYVMDWGLARDARESDAQDQVFRDNESEIQSSVFQGGISSQGSVVGTCGYLAPEQAAGETCDGRADLYALGAILFELMAGRKPIEAPGMAGIVAAMEGRLDIPADLGAGFPPELAALCRRCLAREPSDRPGDAAELGRALRKIRHVLIRGRVKGPRRLASLLIAGLALSCAGLAAALALRPPAVAPKGAALTILEAEPLADRKRPPSLRARARRARLSGDFERARGLLEEMLEASPDDAVARHELGLLFLAIGKPGQAQAELDRAVSLAPMRAEFVKDRGRAFLRRFLFPDAVAELSRAIDLDPKLAEAYAGRGYARYQLGEGAAALPDLDAAIALDGSRARSYRDRALVFEELGETERARADYDKAIALAADDPQAFLDRGNFFLNNKQAAEAEDDFTETIRLKPKAGIAYYFRARARRALGRGGEALADLNQALEIDARSLEVLIERASLRQETGDGGGALADYQAALELGPSEELAAGLKARIAVLEGELAKD